MTRRNRSAGCTVCTCGTVMTSAMFRHLHFPENLHQGMCLKTPVRTSNAKRKAASTAQVSGDSFQRLPVFAPPASALIGTLLVNLTYRSTFTSRISSIPVPKGCANFRNIARGYPPDDQQRRRWESLFVRKPPDARPAHLLLGTTGTRHN